MRPLPITNPSHTAMELEQTARDCKSSSHARRLRAIAMVMRGAERSDAARAQGVDTQTLRDWIVLYMCQATPIFCALGRTSLPDSSQ